MLRHLRPVAHLLGAVSSCTAMRDEAINVHARTHRSHSGTTSSTDGSPKGGRPVATARRARDTRHVTQPLVRLTGLGNVSASCVSRLNACIRVHSRILISMLTTLNISTSDSRTVTTSCRLAGRHVTSALIRPAVIGFVNGRTAAPVHTGNRSIALHLLLRSNAQCRNGLYVCLTPRASNSLALALPSSVPTNCRALHIGTNPLRNRTQLVYTPTHMPLPPTITRGRH